MKAVGYQKSLPASDSQALQDIDIPKPVAKGRDLLVKIEAVSVNPVDTKIRKRVDPEPGEYKVLGWDAAGVVESVGKGVTLFKPGDKVWYSGAINRAGCNAQYHLVDERIVAKMPTSLTFSEAASMPLTSITAWELMFNRIKIQPQTRGSVLIIGAAGGVGSMAIQLARQVTQVTVIATASRPETRDWVLSLGADKVIDHTQSLDQQLRDLGIIEVDCVLGLTHTAEHLNEIAKILAPQGYLGLIDDAPSLDIMPLKQKSISIHWEFMFTRSLFETDDMQEQHTLLTKVAGLVDQGKVKPTLSENFGKICAENLLRAHRLLESGQAKGKIVLTGF